MTKTFCFANMISEMYKVNHIYFFGWCLHTCRYAVDEIVHFFVANIKQNNEGIVDVFILSISYKLKQMPFQHKWDSYKFLVTWSSVMRWNRFYS